MKNIIEIQNNKSVKKEVSGTGFSARHDAVPIVFKASTPVKVVDAMLHGANEFLTRFPGVGVYAEDLAKNNCDPDYLHFILYADETKYRSYLENLQLVELHGRLDEAV